MRYTPVIIRLSELRQQSRSDANSLKFSKAYREPAYKPSQQDLVDADIMFDDDEPEDTAEIQ